MRAIGLIAILALSVPSLVGCSDAADGSSAESNATERQHSLESLTKMSEEELDALYELGDVEGGVPEGSSRGDAMFFGALSFIPNWLANSLWDGKVFFPSPDHMTGKLANHLLLGDSANADTFVDDSTVEIILEYKDSPNWYVRRIVDHMRLIDDELYLGKAYWRSMIFGSKWFVCHFALDFRDLDRTPGVAIADNGGSLDGADATFTGDLACNDCTLASLRDDFPEMNGDRFIELKQGDDSLVLKLNPTDVELSHHVYLLSAESDILAGMRSDEAQKKELQLTGIIRLDGETDDTAQLDGATLTIKTEP